MRQAAGVTPLAGTRRFTALCLRSSDDVGETRDECVAVEEPLEIAVLGAVGNEPLRENVAVTMRTPGQDEELAVGFLCAEGILRCAEDVRDVDCHGNRVEVTLSRAAAIRFAGQRARFARNGVVNASCGVCGKKSIAAVHVRQDRWCVARAFSVPIENMRNMGAQVRRQQGLFDATGGIHAAAWFTGGGTLMALHEDVGRHNALDKLLGHALLADALPLHSAVIWVSGRTSFELVQKAALAGASVLASVGAPSSLAVDLAQDCGMTLVGFLRDDRCNVYAGGERIVV